MRQKKQVRKRISALLLAAALVVPALSTGYVYAQEDDGQKTQTEQTGGAEQQTEQQAEQTDGIMPGTGTPETTSSETGKEETTQGETKASGEGSQAAGENGQPAGENSQTTDADGNDTKTDTEAEGQPEGTQQPEGAQQPEGQPSGAGQEAGTYAYDIDKPVIENVELVQQGQTLKEGDKVEIKVQAYDIVDDPIKEVTVQLSSDEGYYVARVTLNKTERKIYTGTWTVEDVISGEIHISQVKATDSSSNYAVYDYDELQDGEGNWLYTFKVEKQDKITVTEFKFKADDTTLKEEALTAENLGLSVKTDKKVAEEWASIKVRFSDGEGHYFEFYLSAEDGKNFTGTGSYSSYYYGEAKTIEYHLESIYVDRENGEEELLLGNGIKAEDYSLSIEHTARSEQDKPVKVEKIELDNNGQVVHPGDQVEIRITTTGADDRTFLGVYFRSAADIADYSEYVKLAQGEDVNTFTGTFEITEDTYPCEWYLNEIYFSTANGSYYEYLSGSGYPYYVNVQNDGSFVDPVQDTTVNIMKRDADGYWSNISSVKKEKVGRRTSLKELGITLPEMSSDLDGIKQIGWEDENGNEITEDTKLLNEYGYISIYAKYDKIMLRTPYRYVNTDNQWKYDVQLMTVDQGITYGELWKEMEKYTPADMTKEYQFEKWEFFDAGYEEGDLVENHATSVVSSVVAKYKGVKMLNISKRYFDTEGYMAGIDGNGLALAVEENASVKEVEELLKKEPAPEMYEGLRFKEWEVYVGQSELSNGDTISMTALCENYIVRYLVDPRYAESLGESFEPEFLQCQVAEKGDTVKVPTEFDGYGKITWVTQSVELKKDNTFVVGEDDAYKAHDYSFIGYGEKAGSDGGTDKPGDQGDSVNPDAPVTLPDSTVKDIVDMVKNAKDGADPIVVEMGDATVVPKAILEAAKGKDIDIQFRMNGYTWTINGKNIFADNLSDINMEVKFDTGAVPGDIVKELAGDNPTKQLSLTHEGDFGFKATLTMNAGAENQGKYGNLYYYDSEGRMIFMDAGKIAVDGSVNVDFSHASDYVLVMNDKIMGQQENGGDKTGNVKTGDTAGSAVPYVVLMLACAGVCGIVIRKKYSGR